MDVIDIVKLARDQASVSEQDYSDDKVLMYVNLVAKEYWSYIITGIKSNYNWDTWQVRDGDIAVWQTEFETPETASDIEGNLKINSVSLCYRGVKNDDGSLLYAKAREVNPDTLTHHWNYYVNNQSESDPIYFTADKSVFIAPAFSIVIDQGVELRGIKSITNLDITDLEKDIKIPFYMHSDIVLGVIPYIKKSEQLDYQIPQKEYEKAREIALQRLANKSTWPYQMRYPEGSGDNDVLFN